MCIRAILLHLWGVFWGVYMLVKPMIPKSMRPGFIIEFITHTHSSTSSFTYMKVCFLPKKKLPPTSVGLILPANIKFNTTCKAKAEYSIINTF